LSDPETYTTRPDEAWQRVKTRTTSGRFLAIVKELARFREAYAQTHNVPRSRVMKDDALLELASTRPVTMEELGRSRLLQREGRKTEIAEGIIAAIKAGMEMRPEDMPKPDLQREQLQVNPALADLLRVLLKAKSESLGVAPRLIASASDLDAIAAGERDVDALKGWRAEAFGEDALRRLPGGDRAFGQGQRSAGGAVVTGNFAGVPAFGAGRVFRCRIEADHLCNGGRGTGGWSGCCVLCFWWLSRRRHRRRRPGRRFW